MSWSAQMRAARRARGGQADMFDADILSYRLTCDDREPLTNRFVATRKVVECAICDDPIPVGTRVRAESRRSADGTKIISHRICPTCCGCIGARNEPGGMDALDQRYARGSKRWLA